jgi:predicted TIM-barrel fold metal-dependent hydrolase
VREHVRIGLQPVDGPPDPGALAQVVDQIGAPGMLMFATDYPHRHPGPFGELPAGLPEPLLAGILSENARNHYRL